MSTSGYSDLIYGIRVEFRHELVSMSRDRFDSKTGEKKTTTNQDYRIWASHNGAEIQLPDPEELSCEICRPSYLGLESHRQDLADERIRKWTSMFVDDDDSWGWEPADEPAEEVTFTSDHHRIRRWAIIGRIVAQCGTEGPVKVPENCRPSLDELRERISSVFLFLSPELYLQASIG